MIIILSTLNFILMCAIIWLIWDNICFKIDMRKEYTNMAKERDIVTMDLVERIKNEAIERQDYELAEKCRLLLMDYANGGSDYKIVYKPKIN